MPESPLVPDGFAPGTQVPLRPERPLTRREIRERESAALRLGSGAEEDPRGVVPQAVTPWMPAPGTAVWADAPVRPIVTPPTSHALSAPVAPAASTAPATGGRDPFGAAQPRPQRPGFDELFGAAAPVSDQPPTPAASHPIPPATTSASRRRTAEQTQLPFQTPEAEQADRPVGRRSASDVSPPVESASGFDALFAGIVDDDDEEVGTRGSRASRSERPARSDRKAAKAEMAARREKGAKGAKPGKARSGRSAPAGFAAALPAAPAPPTSDRRARRAATDPFDFSTDVAADLFGLTAEPSASTVPSAAPTLRGDAPSVLLDAAAESPDPSRGDRRRRQPPRDAARRTPRNAKVRVRVSARSQSHPVASAPRRRGGRQLVASLVAMSFAALLAVATTIPSLSLLTPSDVQALALSSTNGPALDGQRVVLNGDIVAQSVQREGYESQTIEEYARAAGIRPEATFTNNPSGTIQWPFAVGVHIGDRFGYRDCWGCSSNHGGQDFNPGLGAEIQAIADGVVSNSTDSGGSLGVVMMIDHVIDGELITSVYAHMEYDSRRFEVGDTVEVGDVIGTTGDTGMSTGPHLHFEIRIGGINGTKVDPLVWLYENTN